MHRHFISRALKGALTVLTLTCGALSEALALSSGDLLERPPSVNVEFGEGLNPAHRIEGASATGKYLLKWKDFNLESGESLSFTQGSYLNLVKGPNRSLINGQISGLKANVFILNPNGITLGRDSAIQVESLGLSTVKPTLKLLEDFHKSGTLNLSSSYSPDGTLRGMGEIKLLGQLKSHNLLLDGSQIVIRDYTAVRNKNNGLLTHADVGSAVNTLQLGASTQRIDIGGPAAGTGEAPAFDPESAYGLSLADGLVDQRGKHAVGTKEELLDISADLNGDYWLYDDIEGVNLDAPLGAFTGSLDGAYHRVGYSLKSDAENLGLFCAVESADIAHLKLKDVSIATKEGRKAGALAGTVKDSSLEDVEVSVFKVSYGGESPESFLAGALSGSLEGGTLTNVITGGVKGEGTVAGALSGTVTGEPAVHGLSAATDGTLPLTADGTSLKGFGTSLEEGLKLAAERGESAPQHILRKGSATHRLFLTPFFVEDFETDYDGRTRSYAEAVNNDCFDLENHVTLKPEYAGDIRNAGTYHHTLVSGDGERYFVKDGVFSAESDGLYTVNKVHLGTLKLTDLTSDAQRIEVGLNESTVKNASELNFVNGENLDTLNLTAVYTRNPDGTYSATVNDALNYTFDIEYGTVHEPPAPPEPEPDTPEIIPVPDKVTPSLPEVRPVMPASDELTVQRAHGVEEDVSPCDFCKGPERFMSEAGGTLPTLERPYAIAGREQLSALAATASGPAAEDDADEERLYLASSSEEDDGTEERT